MLYYSFPRVERDSVTECDTAAAVNLLSVSVYRICFSESIILINIANSIRNHFVFDLTKTCSTLMRFPVGNSLESVALSAIPNFNLEKLNLYCFSLRFLFFFNMKMFLNWFIYPKSYSKKNFHKPNQSENLF